MGAKLTIEEMQKLAANHGGKCLSDVYKGAFVKLRWQCADGHIWEAIPTNIKSAERWCPTCGGSSPLNLQLMQNLAEKRGGKCLSKEYKNNRTNLRWQCSNGHEWDATPSSVKYSGTWCPFCSGRRKTIQDMQSLARGRGGKCLSDSYINNREKLKWQCAKGHIWEAVPSSIQMGSWCPACVNHAPITIKQLQNIAKERGGKLLSERYVDNLYKLKWQCADGHQWYASPSNVKNHHKWCPICGLRKGVNENICREVFEFIFKRKFPKIKPIWLLNNEGRKMELDGYNEKLAIAFEYQGRQHYEHIKYFHGTDKDKLSSRLNDDEIKRHKCRERGIKLIEIPFTVAVFDIPDYIIDQCRKARINLPKNTKVDIRKLRSRYHLKNLRELQQIAEKQGGKLLSVRYLNTMTKLEWQCAKGHVWQAIPANIKKGIWCRKCAKRFPLTIEEMQNIAKKHGGKCLSELYINNLTKLKWQCVKGHIWEAAPVTVKQRGAWCPYCAGNAKLSIEDMQILATNRGGICLSKKYINAQTKLEWQCVNGHKWEATPNGIKNGQWCPKCALSKRWETRRSKSSK